MVLPSRNDFQKTDAETIVMLNGTEYLAIRTDYVNQLSGQTCLQLTSGGDSILRIEGDALEVAEWF